jgi:hypothetical protein
VGDDKRNSFPCDFRAFDVEAEFLRQANGLRIDGLKNEGIRHTGTKG